MCDLTEKMTFSNEENQKAILKKRKMNDFIFKLILLISITFCLSLLFILFQSILLKGIKYLNIDFFNQFTSRFPEKAGIKAALGGTVWIITMAVAMAFPVGVGASIYLQEYATKNKFTSFIQSNINNLAGIPAIVYGILGLTVFVRFLGFGRSILSASLTMAMLMLPIIIVSAQEALKTVPQNLKEASYALGMTKWQTIVGVIIPYAMPGILTGTILAVSRGIGEASPLVVVGGVGAIWFSPKSVMDGFTTLPLQIYSWSGMPKEEFQQVAATGILVLVGILIVINLGAILLRSKYQDRIRR